MKRLVFGLILAVTCGHVIAADTEGPKISGTLFRISSDGKEIPPPTLYGLGKDGKADLSTPARSAQIEVGYWVKKEFKSVLMGKKGADGQVVVVCALGSTQVNSDGTFSVVAILKALPPGVTTIGLHYTGPDGYAEILYGDKRAPIKIEISDGRSEIELGKIRLRQ